MKMMSRLVICEDNEMICQLLGQVFEQEHRDVVVTRTTAECRNACAHGETRVLLTDLMLQGENTLGLIQQLRTERPQITIIALTGGGDAWVEAAVVQGAHCVLEKPVDIDGLTQVIDRFLAGFEHA